MRHAAKPRTGAANLKWPRGADSLPSVVDIVVPLGVALLTVLGTVFSRGLPWKGERDRIARDLDLMERLPAASEGRKLLGDQVERRIQGLINREREKRRDVTGIVLALVFVSVGVFLVIVAAVSSGWWWLLLLPVVFALLLGAFGLSQNAVPRLRDEKGRPMTMDMGTDTDQVVRENAVDD